jgi:hypothetical protein
MHLYDQWVSMVMYIKGYLTNMFVHTLVIKYEYIADLDGLQEIQKRINARKFSYSLRSEITVGNFVLA